MKKYPCREIVGSCLYLSVMTRLDIAYVINYLARSKQNTGKVHWNALRHLLRYLRGTSDLGLRLGPCSRTVCDCFCDASWADNADDRHSTSGYCFRLWGSMVAW